LGSRASRWGMVAIWMAAIFTVSGIPKLDMPGCLSEIGLCDKIGHALAYAVLGALALRALSNSRADFRTAAIAVAIAVAYGLTDEYHQLHVPGRSFDLYDLAADSLGAGVAVMWTALLKGVAANGRRTKRRDL